MRETPVPGSLPMRITRLLLLGTLLTTFALLATDVLDFCRVADDGSVSWAPRIRTAAIRKYGALAWHAIAPGEVPAPQVARAR